MADTSQQEHSATDEQMVELLREAVEDDRLVRQRDAQPTPAERAWPSLDRIGPFKILSVLGEGGMGIVYLAQQEQPIRRKVALKIIKPGMDSERIVARFSVERQTLAMMNHPGIAKIYEAGTTQSGQPWFAME